MFKKILVCLDGSALAEQIVPYVAEEAHCFGEIVLLRVVPLPEIEIPFGVPGAPSAPVNTDRILQEYKRELGEAPDYLDRTAQPFRDNKHKVRCVVLEGNAGNQIVEYARSNDIGIIAIATHGRSGLRRVIFGSTAEHVLQNAGLPVLLIRSH
jgi:nucleotide-binding universal stress UspA family protein